MGALCIDVVTMILHQYQAFQTLLERMIIFILFCYFLSSNSFRFQRNNYHNNKLLNAVRLRLQNPLHSDSHSDINEMKSEVSSTSLTASSSPSIPSCMNVTMISTPSKDQRFLRDLSTIDDWIAKEGEGGIDIFGVVKNMKDFFTWRESEIKHGRLAMLAAFGWPVSELYHYKLSQSVGLMDFLATGERAPSVLNGGLDNTYVLLGLGVFVAVGASLELQLLNRRKQQPDELQNFYNMWREDGWDAPGNYGFGKRFPFFLERFIILISVRSFTIFSYVLSYTTIESVYAKY